MRGSYHENEVLESVVAIAPTARRTWDAGLIPSTVSDASNWSHFGHKRATLAIDSSLSLLEAQTLSSMGPGGPSR